MQSLPRMFTELLPPDFCVEIGDPREPEPELLPAELPLVERAVAKRRREFATGRACARAALARFGIHDFALLVGSQREPLWPPGIIGSISHVDRLCAVAVGRNDRYAGVGIDIEYARPIERGVRERVLFAADTVNANSVREELAAALIFSAKEAFYKCQFYVSRKFLNFSDVAIAIACDHTFSAQLRVPAGSLALGTTLTGRWREHAGLFLTALCLPRSGHVGAENEHQHEREP